MIPPGDVGGRRGRLALQEPLTPDAPGRVGALAAERLAARVDDAHRVVLRHALDDPEVFAVLADFRWRAVEDVVREKHSGPDCRVVLFRAGHVGQVGQRRRTLPRANRLGVEHVVFALIEKLAIAVDVHQVELELADVRVVARAHPADPNASGSGGNEEKLLA